MQPLKRRERVSRNANAAQPFVLICEFLIPSIWRGNYEQAARFDPLVYHGQELTRTVKTVDQVRRQHQIVTCIERFQVTGVGLLERDAMPRAFKVQVGQFCFLIGDQFSLLDSSVAK